MKARLMAVACLASAIAEAAERKTILFVQQAGIERQAMTEFLVGFREKLDKNWPAPVAIGIEEIDANLPNDPKLREWLTRKYEWWNIDLITAVEGPGSRLGSSLRQVLQPAAPVVVTGVGTERYQGFLNEPNLTGVTIDQDVSGLLRSAHRLCPEASHLVFMPGGMKTTLEARNLWKQDAEQFATKNGMGFTDLTGTQLPQALKQIGAIPSSIVLRRDTIVGGLTRPVDRAAVTKQISQAAAGPLFTVADAFAEDASVGTGFVDYKRLGAEVADQVVAVFEAGEASAVPVVKSAAFTTSFDWRQLQRWGLDENRLPPGSDVRFRQPGLWEAHRKTMIAITSAIIVQATLITALLLQRRWRRRAELALSQQREQLAHTLRLATMSQMAESLAHELNQPLASMVTNAGAARRIIRNKAGDTGELHEILQDITDEGHRAGEVIRAIRSMVRAEAATRTTVELNELVVGMRRLVGAESVKRGFAVVEELAPALPKVGANAVQLQQVLLNLLMNAFDAGGEPGAGSRRVVIRTEAEDDHSVCVSVRDFGPGLPPEGPEKLFGQFYTTKAHGMGMGLVIVRSIVEEHGGSIGATNAEGGGARFHFRLPALKEKESAA